MHDTFHDVIPG
jgi:hypothetical protein